jgi:pyruvate dehydrogenase E1 component alpha subunit
MIEAVTYRLGDHTTADDARRYRDAEELERAKERDPLIRTRLYLEKKGLWDEDRQKALQEKAEAIVAEETRAAESIAEPVTQDMFNDMFAELPDELVRQRDTLRTSSIGQNPAQIGLMPTGGNDNAGGATWQA